MAKIYYVRCSFCQKEFYIDNILFEYQKDKVTVKCPYCKKIETKPKETAVITK